MGSSKNSLYRVARRIEKREKAVAKIAADHGIETLDQRHSDGLDFHDVSVWTLKAMLDAAYKAGQEARKGGE